MSDGSGGLSGTFEFISDKAKQGGAALGKAAGNVVTSAAKQVTGNGGVQGGLSGSFDVKGGLAGGDLFSPDMKGGQQPQQMGKNGAAQPTSSVPTANSDQAKIASIQDELKAMMHKQNYYDPMLAKLEQIRREREQKYQQKEEEKQVKQMEDLQQKQQQQQNTAVFNASHGMEIKGSSTG